MRVEMEELGYSGEQYPILMFLSFVASIVVVILLSVKYLFKSYEPMNFLLFASFIPVFIIVITRQFGPSRHCIDRARSHNQSVLASFFKELALQVALVRNTRETAILRELQQDYIVGLVRLKQLHEKLTNRGDIVELDYQFCFDAQYVVPDELLPPEMTERTQPKTISSLLAHF